MRSNRSSVYRFAIILATLLATAFHAHAQTPTPSPTPSVSASPTLEHEFFKNILRDQKAIWTAPVHLHRGDARWLAPLGLGTAALVATDRTTATAVAQFDDQLSASHVISYPGSTYGAAGVGAIFYLIGRARHDSRARETGLLSWEALIDSELLVVPLKAIAERRRPLSIRHRGDFFRVGTSFPSGHAIHAWAVAAVVANEYSDHRAVKVAAYGLAAAVSLARFTGEKHFLSDILVGSAMGYGIGRYVYHAHHRTSSGGNDGDEEESLVHSRRWPAIAPLYDRHARDYGVALAWSF
jgi:membrane-associated phospholipid phosphatase